MVFFALPARLCAAFGEMIAGRLLAYGRIIAVLVCLAVRRLRPRRRRSVAAIYDRRDGRRDGLEAPPAKPPASRGRPRRLPRDVADTDRAGSGARSYRSRRPTTNHRRQACSKRRSVSDNRQPLPGLRPPAPRRRIVLSEPRIVLHYFDLAPQRLTLDTRRPAPDNQQPIPDTRPPIPDHRQPVPDNRPAASGARPRAPHLMTEKRRAVLRLAQQHAALARKRDRSPSYAPGFLTGYLVADPSRALALSGATLQEYEAHLAVYDIGLQPFTEREEKLALATALVSWKALTGWRLYGDTEALAVWEGLDRLASERQAGAKLTPARLMSLARELSEVFERWLDLDEQQAPLEHRLLQLLREGIVERGGPRQRRRGLRPSPIVENFNEHRAERCWPPRGGQ
jgi:hypothetical protein